MNLIKFSSQKKFSRPFEDLASFYESWISDVEQALDQQKGRPGIARLRRGFERQDGLKSQAMLLVFLLRTKMPLDWSCQSVIAGNKRP